MTAVAMVVGAEVVAGHDGAAELLVRVRHENGVVGDTIFSSEVAFAMMLASGVERLQDLVGRPWLQVIKGVVNV